MPQYTSYTFRSALCAKAKQARQVLLSVFAISSIVMTVAYPSTLWAEESSLTVNPDMQGTLVSAPALSLSASAAGQSLVPYMDFFVDPSGELTLLELFSPSYSSAFTPLAQGIPLTDSGSTWLRLNLVPQSLGPQAQGDTNVLDSAYAGFGIDLGSVLSSDIDLYIPEVQKYVDSLAKNGAYNVDMTAQWQAIHVAQGEMIPLPQLHVLAKSQMQGFSIPVYIHMAGTPELWFIPHLRTMASATKANSDLIHISILMMLTAIVALCLLRAGAEKGQWRFWTTAFATTLLVQSIVGLPTTPHGSIGLSGLVHVLAPAIALMLLPHIARHMLRSTEFSAMRVPPLGSHIDGDLDRQYRLLSIPCILVAIVPLLPYMGWSAKVLPLWPACVLLFIPTTIIAVLRKIQGAKLFLLACIAPLLGVLCALLGILFDMPTMWITNAPLCGMALGALVIAGAYANQKDTHDSSASHGLNKGKRAIVIREDYDDPLSEGGLRLVSPDEPFEGHSTGESLSIIPPEEQDFTGSDSEFVSAVKPRNSSNINIDTGSKTLHSALRAPLKEEESTALKRAEESMLSPLATLRQSVQSLKESTLSPSVEDLVYRIGTATDQLTSVEDEFRRATYGLPAENTTMIFDLQRCLRDAHDNVCERSDAKGIALSWFMAPHLALTYQGDAERLHTTLRLLMESAVQATDQGSVHLSARRVPDSTNPGHLLFTITDTGAGGPPERRNASAFARAWELATSTGGSLSIDSSISGTTISFSTRFLAMANDSQQNSNAEQDHNDLGLVQDKTARIIIGAPAPSNRQLLAFYLENTAYEAVEALSTIDIMVNYVNEGAALIILDGDLAETDIREIIRTVQNHDDEQGKAPVPFLALVRDEKQADTLLQMGCTQTLIKPVTRSGLCAQAALLAPLASIPLSAMAITQTEDELQEGLEEEQDEVENTVTDQPVNETTTDNILYMEPEQAPEPSADLISEVTPFVDFAHSIDETENPASQSLEKALADTQEESATLIMGTASVEKEPEDNALFIADRPLLTENVVLLAEDSDAFEAVQHHEPEPSLEYSSISEPTVEASQDPEIESKTDSVLEPTLRLNDELAKADTLEIRVEPLLDPALEASLEPELEPVFDTQDNEGCHKTEISSINACDMADAIGPRSEAENITLQIFSEYMQGEASTVSPSMQALDPILFTDVLAKGSPNPSASVMTGAMPSVMGNAKNVKQNPIHSSTLDTDTEGVGIPQAHRTAQAHGGLEQQANTSSPAEALYIDTQNTDTTYSGTNSMEADVSAPRPVQRSVSDEAQGSAPYELATERAQPHKLAPEGVDLEETVGIVEKTPHVQRHAPSAPSHGNEVCVEEVTVGSETLRVFKNVSASPVDPDTAYEAMVAREAEHISNISEDINIANIIDNIQSIVKATESEGISDTMEQAPQEEFAPVQNTEVLVLEKADSFAQQAEDIVAPTFEEAPQNTIEDMSEGASTEIYLELDSTLDDREKDEAEKIEPMEVLTDYPKAEYDLEYDSEYNEDTKQPSAVEKATAALFAMCTNLREPAPLRLREMSLPSLRALRKALDNSVQQSAQENARTSDVQAITENMNTPPRIASVAQTVNELAATIKPTPSILQNSSRQDFVPDLIRELSEALNEAYVAYDQDDVVGIQEMAARIADNAEGLGLRALERRARCIERAAMADDLNAARELLPEMVSAVQRTITALEQSGLDGVHRA